MTEGRYEPGDPVPEELFESPGGAALVFRITVEVVSGFDNVQHVYPSEPVDGLDEVVGPSEGNQWDVDPGPDTEFYTVPRSY